jgi:hypothetical protein
MEVALTSGQFTSAAERQARLIDCLRTAKSSPTRRS